jgi:hypothetical protein
MTSASIVRLLPNAGVSAFNAEGEMVMSLGKPVVQAYLTLDELQESICTLERAIEDEPSFAQRMGLERILCRLLASVAMIKENHEQFLQDAPSGADLEEYLTTYSQAVKGTF